MIVIATHIFCSNRGLIHKTVIFLSYKNVIWEFTAAYSESTASFI